jgi:uncharacterized protein YndB with AHSA1/START domain
MATVDHTMTLQAEPAEVFEYLTDPEKEPVWQSSLLEVRFSSEGPLQQGTRITEVRKFLGRRMESTVEVTDFEPQRIFAGRVLSGPVPWEFRYALEPTDGATRLSFRLEGEPGGFFRLAEPLVVRAVKKQLEADFSTLKEIVESG